ncbi:hypothetical protein ACO0BK_002093, partial [Neisseria gonorrhoeae]
MTFGQKDGFGNLRAGGNPALSVRKLIGKTVSLDFAFRIPTFVGMTGCRFPCRRVWIPAYAGMTAAGIGGFGGVGGFGGLKPALVYR